MVNQEDHYSTARTFATAFLRQDSHLTSETVRAYAARAIDAVHLLAPSATIDIDALTAELLHIFSVRAGEITVLEDHDPTSHEVWLPGRKAGVQWRFWERYQTYLEHDFGMPLDVVANLHRLTDMILERLEDPSRDGPWDRRGMVVGSVQSGKTANYIGLINKAVDSGYKLVIILAGIHSNLRSQTQLRVDEGVLGFDTQKSRRLHSDNRWVGVGRYLGDKLVIHSLTSSAEDGDFNKTVAENIGVMLGGDPVVLVVKKNSRLLSNLIRWVVHVSGTDAGGRRVVPHVPMLLIDDEADNASINIKDRGEGAMHEESVSAINGRIRELLAAFEKSAYVGYTATPFANIFINPDAQTEKHGEDVFPRSFIINVNAPTNHVGPARLFGIDGDPDAGIPSHEPLPLIREVNDYGDVPSSFPPRHRKEHEPTALPGSLKEALRCFVLGCAARRARGQVRVHNSMLVHVTRFVAVQERAVRLLEEELAGIQRRLALGDGRRRPTLREELEELWDRDFVPTSQAVKEDGGRQVTFAEVDAQLHDAAAKIVVIPINGYARDALEYKEHEGEGRSLVAVGGDKLSRGLTLEGLSVSYFLRTSRMYDTLMQMGRWFGYRSGYLDLCRLYTTRTLVSWYKHIALAEAELRREFDYMVAAGLTPRQYGLRVRTHPDGMIVTALNKMCHSQRLLLSWSGVLVQTAQLPKGAIQLAANQRAVEELLANLPTPRTMKGAYVWCGVRARSVAAFIENLQYPPEAARAAGQQLAAFVRKQSEKPTPELTEWTVALISNSQASTADRRQVAGYGVGLVVRTPESQIGTTLSLKNANILNPADESVDFEDIAFDRTWLDDIVDKEELAGDLEWLEEQAGRPASEVALDLTLRWQGTKPPKVRPPKMGKTQRPNGRVVRVLRRRRYGLLLIYPLKAPESVTPAVGEPGEPTGLDPGGPPIIGLALSFPTSTTVEGVEYRVNKVWEAELREDSEYED